jgi:hypothetical protein
MKRKYFTAICFFLAHNLPAQSQGRQLEFKPFVRIDKYPEFSYVLMGRPSTDYINVKGTSFGINLAYKIPIAKSLLIKPGIGYYKYSYNDITRYNTSFGTSDARNINFISPLLIPFFSDKYYYNTLSANIAMERTIPLRNNYLGAIGVELNNYFTFSQHYHLTNNPIGSQNFKKADKKYFGTSGLLFFNFLKKVKKVTVGPSVLIPVFDSWKTDKIFYEETVNDLRSKWFKGIGFGISINYSLK